MPTNNQAGGTPPPQPPRTVDMKELLLSTDPELLKQGRASIQQQLDRYTAEQQALINQQVGKFVGLLETLDILIEAHTPKGGG